MAEPDDQDPVADIYNEDEELEEDDDDALEEDNVSTGALIRAMTGLLACASPPGLPVARGPGWLPRLLRMARRPRCHQEWTPTQPAYAYQSR